MSLLLLSGEPLFHGKPIIHVVPYGEVAAAETHEHAASFPALHGPDHVNGALVQRNTLVDGTTINNLRVGADPDVSNAELADGMPPGLVVEKEHITEFLNLADNSYLYYSPATLVGEDLVQDAHSYVQVGRSPDAALDEEKYDGVRLAHKLDDAAGLRQVARLMCHKDTPFLYLQGDKTDATVGYIKVHRDDGTMDYYLGRGPDGIESVLVNGTSELVDSNNTDRVTLKCANDSTSLDIESIKTSGDKAMIKCVNDGDIVFEVRADGTVLFNHHTKIGEAQDGVFGDDSVYIGSARLSYTRDTHLMLLHKLKHQIPTYLQQQGFALADMPAGYNTDDMSVHDWTVSARLFLSDNAIKASTVFPPANVLDWETTMLSDNDLWELVNEHTGDIAGLDAALVINTANIATNAADIATNTAGKQDTLNFVAVSANDANPSTSAQIKTYVDDAVGSQVYVQYSTPGDESAGNGIGVMAGNGSVAGDGFIELDKANGTSYYYACRMNEQRMRFTFRFTETHSAMYMGLVIFNDTITQYTTSKMVITKKMRLEEVGNPEELGRVLVHQTACSFRNGGVSTTLVNSNVYIMVRMTTTGEGNPDNLDHVVEDHCDNESGLFIGYDDNSSRDIQTGTEFFLYVTLTEEET